MTRHPDRNPDLPLEDGIHGLLASVEARERAEAARPGTFAAAALPTGEDRGNFYEAIPTGAVVLQWNAEGRHYEHMLSATTLESAVRTAAALNANQES